MERRNNQCESVVELAILTKEIFPSLRMRDMQSSVVAMKNLTNTEYRQCMTMYAIVGKKRNEWKGENIGMTETQKRAFELQKEIENVCIQHGFNMTILGDGIGFVDPKENKVVMIWRPQYKPDIPSLLPMELHRTSEYKPETQKPSGGNMSAFIYGNPKGGGRFAGNRKKHTIKGMKKR